MAVAQRGSDGRLTVWTSAQSPYWTRFELATALGIPMGDIRVIICTHSHADHSPGAAPLQKLWKALRATSSSSAAPRGALWSLL